ncbi:MAG: cardiolipin synthase [Bacillota bacterium]|jgi:cardiolipin synthase|nr:cardiolipin synthase [Bacillota bacterium]NLJ02263.1 cardiolipin synthase [Bacillota bacterium]
MKRILSLLLHRVTVISLAILAQLLAIVLMVGRFSDYFQLFYVLLTLLSAVVLIFIATGHQKSAYKIAWIIPIILFPIFGGLFYLVLGNPRPSRRMRRKMLQLKIHGERSLVFSKPVLDKLVQLSEHAGNQARYIQNHALYPVYENTSSHFFPLGELAYESMLEELAKAERYIFLEYFIIEEGVMWNTILDILVEKVRQGVDVRLIYDDVGCLFKLPYRYHKKLEALGIKTERFHPLTPRLSAMLNYRDHRKLMIIDGHTGFTGGINLADEYINAYEKLGHWKDSAFLVRGEPVWSLTMMFLAMWEYLRGETSSVDEFRPAKLPEAPEPQGFIQPFGDNPLDGETVSETVYLNLISRAVDYVYITTPYLILDNEVLTALSTAAKSGVDVRIITPHIPDKPIVHAVTRSYYHILMQSGVRIYEYTPGFMHSKTIVADDEVAVVGSINLDYRSLYLAFENGVWLYQTPSVMEIKEDFLDTLAVCEEVNLRKYGEVGTVRRFTWSLLRLLAPLL